MADTTDSDTQQKLVDDLVAVQTEFDVPVFSVIIVDKNNVLLHETIGVMDRDTRIPADSSTLFRVGSITKMFTGLTMAMIEEQGLWRLDDPVKQHMADFPFSNEWETTHPVRIKHLLEHTSGLTELTWEEFRHPEQMELEDAIMWKAEGRKTNYPPGLFKVYSNASPGYAAYLFEQVTKKKFEDFVEQRIFKPLAMNDSGFFPDEDTLARLPTGYDRDGHTVIPYWHMIYRAFGAMNASPQDMGRFIQFLLNDGTYKDQKLVNASTIRRMETATSTLAAKDGLEFGYGLGLYPYLRKGHIFYGHGGDADGYLTRLGYNREKELGYFLVINVFDHTPLTRMRNLVEDFIIENEIRKAPAPYALPLDVMQPYTGEYEVVAARFQRRDSEKRTARIYIDEGKLFIESRDKKNRLYPVTNNHFRYRNQTVATSAFVEYEGELYFQDFDVSYRRLNNN